MAWRWVERPATWMKKKVSHTFARTREGVGTFSGKRIKETLDDYSEVYGEVLLGLHRDLRSQGRHIEDVRNRLNEEMEAQRQALEDIRSVIEKSQAPQPFDSRAGETKLESLFASQRKVLDSLGQETRALRAGLRRAYGVTAAALILAVLGFFV